VVAGENADPALHVVLPGLPDSDRTIAVLFPEHVTARKKSSSEAEHLYLFWPGQTGSDPCGNRTEDPAVRKGFRWRIHMLARAHS